MSTGSLSDAEDFPEVEMLACDGGGGLKMDRGSPGLLPPALRGAPHGEEGSGGGGGGGERCASPGRRGRGGRAAPSAGGGGGGARKKAPRKGCPLGGAAAGPEGKQVQRNAANARERARMRVLSKAFSRLKTTLPWVPPDTKLSKLDTLRLASSYIAHLRQILASDKFENGYIHPVNLTWPFMVAGKPENELKEAGNTTRLCGPTAS